RSCSPWPPGTPARPFPPRCSSSWGTSPAGPRPLPPGWTAAPTWRSGKPAQKLERTALGQWLVEVAALGRLDAGRAPGVAGALGDQPLGVVHQALELLI